MLLHSRCNILLVVLCRVFAGGFRFLFTLFFSIIFIVRYYSMFFFCSHSVYQFTLNLNIVLVFPLCSVLLSWEKQHTCNSTRLHLRLHLHYRFTNVKQLNFLIYKSWLRYLYSLSHSLSCFTTLFMSSTQQKKIRSAGIALVAFINTTKTRTFNNISGE